MSGPGRRGAGPGWAVGGVAAVVLGAGVGLAALGRPRAAAPVAQVSTGTAPVTRGTVSERVRIPGVLGFDGAYAVAHQGPPGIVTSVGEPGAVVGCGGVLYAVANEPVRLLFGAVPAYRGLAAGMPDGPDVQQLEANLAALGFDPGRVDARFTAGTTAAVRRWQAAWGLPPDRRTGALPFGSVVFAPVALRVAQVSAPVGAAVQPGAPVLAATSTSRVVTAQLSTDRQTLVHAGDAVQVTVTGAATVPGVVLRVGTVAAAPQQQDGRGGAAMSGSEPATVPVTVRVTLPPGGPDLDQAPVQISVTTVTREDVLLVPVVALLARPGGGYQVRLADGRLVQVSPGLFDGTGGVVEVTGDLTAGQLVEVPAP